MTKKEKKTIEIRTLTGDDIFPIITILDKMGLIDQIQTIFKDLQEQTVKVHEEIVKDLIASGKKEEDITEADLESDVRTAALNNEIIIKLVMKVIVKLPSARKEINQFIADITGLAYTDVKKLSIVEYKDVIFDFFKQPELAELLESITG